MTTIRIRPRSSIADPELARAAVVDLPAGPTRRRVHAALAIRGVVASFRRSGAPEPERVIVLTLSPVAVRQR
jgi:hypothetical protein